MALTCALTCNATAYQAGQTPPPVLYLTVANPSGVPVAITGAQVVKQVAGDMANDHTTALPIVVPVGAGQTVVVPANGSILVGPMTFASSMGSNSNSLQSVLQTGNTNTNPAQVAMPSTEQVVLSAIVYGSDGSVNYSAPCGLCVSYSFPPAASTQGGYLNFGAGTNFANGLLLGVL